jgi:GDP-L-fucose synthase
MENVDFNDLKPQKGQLLNTHINIGTGKDLTISDLSNLIKGVAGFKGQLTWDDSKPDGTQRKLLDVSKINKLGWKEKISLDDGVMLIYEKYSG